MLPLLSLSAQGRPAKLINYISLKLICDNNHLSLSVQTLLDLPQELN